LAEAGRISKGYLSKFDIGQEVYWGHIEWDVLLKMIKKQSISFLELPKYPSVKTRSCSASRQEYQILPDQGYCVHTERSVLQDISLFDVYENDSLGINKKSYAVSFILRDDLKTMTDKNIDRIMQNLIKALKKNLMRR